MKSLNLLQQLYYTSFTTTKPNTSVNAGCYFRFSFKALNLQSKRLRLLSLLPSNKIYLDLQSFCLFILDLISKFFAWLQIIPIKLNQYKIHLNSSPHFKSRYHLGRWLALFHAFSLFLILWLSIMTHMRLPPRLLSITIYNYL